VQLTPGFLAETAFRTNTMMQRFGRVWFVVALAALMGTSQAAAQNVTTTGQIRGRIVDPNGQPVVGASVVARNTQTGLERASVTQSDGIYIVRLLPAGVYALRTEMIGFGAQQQPAIRVMIGQSVTANFQLQTQAVQLEGIAVTATRPP
jgi:hypothetical protein